MRAPQPLAGLPVTRGPGWVPWHGGQEEGLHAGDLNLPLQMLSVQVLSPPAAPALRVGGSGSFAQFFYSGLEQLNQAARGPKRRARLPGKRRALVNATRVRLPLVQHFVTFPDDDAKYFFDDSLIEQWLVEDAKAGSTSKAAPKRKADAVRPAAAAGAAGAAPAEQPSKKAKATAGLHFAYLWEDGGHFIGFRCGTHSYTRPFFLAQIRRRPRPHPLSSRPARPPRKQMIPRPSLGCVACPHSIPM